MNRRLAKVFFANEIAHYMSMRKRRKALGSGSLKRQRSQDAVDRLKARATMKRADRACKLRINAMMRDQGYYRTDFGSFEANCFHRAGGAA